jgi:hypothetical protein
VSHIDSYRRLIIDGLTRLAFVKGLKLDIRTVIVKPLPADALECKILINGEFKSHLVHQ